MLKIDRTLKDLIPPLQPDEYKTLEESIKAEGCRDKIITWQGYIVDGHNRYDICTRYGIEYETDERFFEDIEAVKVWMIDNQKGRRNLTDGWKWELAQTKKAILAEKGKETQGMRTDLLPTIGKKLHNTQAIIAQELGWSKGKVSMADKVWKEADPEVKEKVKAGEVSINQAYQEVKKQKKKEELESKKQEYQDKIEVRSGKISVDIYATDTKYRVIYADPAWNYNDAQDISSLGGASKHYNTLTTSQICELPVKNISEKDAVLFLWVTSPLLEDGMRVIKEWGFKYKSSFIWDKIKHNMGHYNSVRHEFLLIATRGSCVPDNKKLYDSVQSIEKSDKHSQKPKEFLDIIDDIYTYGDRIELFAREAYSASWDVWGNEI